MMENPASYSLLTKKEAREYLETKKLPDDWHGRLVNHADLVANTWACSNCDDRKCMGCVLRYYDHECEDEQCPSCC